MSVAPQKASYDAVKIQAQLLNAKGGINGHPVNVTGCDDQTDPNVAVSCAQQAVSSHVAAVLGSFSLVTTPMWPVLDAAGIPFIGIVEYAPADTTNAEAYPVTPPAPYIEATATSYLFKNQHCAAVADVQANSGVDSTIPVELNKAVASADGGKYVGPFLVSPTSAIANVGALATSILSQAKCANIADGQNGVALIQALLQLDPSFEVATGYDSLPANWPAELGAGASHVHSIGQIAPTTSSAAGVQAYNKSMAQYASGDTLSEESEVSWAAFYVFSEAAAQISGAVTAQSLTAQLKQSSNLSTEGMTPPVSYTQALTVGPMTRVFSTNAFLEGASNGQVVQVGGPLTGYVPST